MNCRRVRALLSAYIDKEMTGQEMLEINRHLVDCDGCRAEHESFVQVKAIISGLPLAEPNPAWLTSLTISAHDLALPFYERWRLRLFQSDLALSFNMRRMTSAVMLSTVAIFMVSASFDHNVRVAEPPSSSDILGATQVHYSPGQAFQDGRWLATGVAIPDYMPGAEARDFPVSHNIYWPAADPMPAFGPRSEMSGRPSMTLVGFGGSGSGFGSR